MEKKKKIILCVTNDLNNDQRMQRICTSMQNAGFDVLLIGRKRNNSHALSNQCFKQKRFNGLFKRGFLFYAEFNIRLFFFLLFSDFKIVCGIDLDTLPAASFAAKLKGKKIVYDAHEYFPESPELKGRDSVKYFWNRIESFFLPKADAVYTVSNGIKEIFERKYNHKVELIRNMPFNSSSNKKDSVANYIIYQGALNVGRGLEQLIEVMPNINAELWLAGDGDISQILKAQAADQKDKIKFLGKVDPRELKSITANAILGINLLKHMGESYYHSLSNKFFDYVMAEIPQICINFPEYKKLNNVFEVAVLVENLDQENLTKEINILLANQKLRQNLIENCKAAKLEWNWEKEALQLIEIYNNLV